MIIVQDEFLQAVEANMSTDCTRREAESAMGHLPWQIGQLLDEVFPIVELIRFEVQALELRQEGFPFTPRRRAGCGTDHAG